MRISPTQRSLSMLRGRGFTCAITEHWNPHVKIRQDLYGFIDLLYLDRHTMGVVAVQTTSGSNVSSRVAKVKASDKAALWLVCGNQIVVHGWKRYAKQVERKWWRCREVWLALDDGVIAEVAA